MAGESVRINIIALEGDWSMNGITHQFQALMNWINQSAQPAGVAAPPELDLSGVTKLDACGCQLLSAFVLYLREQGIMPLCHEMTEEISFKVKSLGFDQLIDFKVGLTRVCP